MKRFLSWLVLPVCYVVVYFWFTLVYRLALFAYSWLSGLSTIWIIICVLVFGSVALAFIFAPLKWGAILTVTASNAICPSARGERFRTFSVLLLIFTVVSFFMSLKILNTINIACIFGAIYCISLMVMSKSASEEA